MSSRWCRANIVLTNDRDSCACVDVGSLEALVTVTMSVFLSTEHLSALRVKAFDHRFKQDWFDILLSNPESDYYLLRAENSMEESVISTATLYVSWVQSYAALKSSPACTAS